jgi:hypothetical protein
LFFYFLLLKLVPETIRSKKKFGFIFHHSFYVQYSRIQDPVLFYPQDQGSGFGMKNLGIRMPRSRIKHHGSATLLGTVSLWKETPFKKICFRYCDIDVVVLAVKPMLNSRGEPETPAMIQIDARYTIISHH